MFDLTIGDAVFDGDEMFFFDNSLQALCQADLHEKKVIVIACWTGRRFNIRWIHMYKNRLYMAERTSLAVLCYSIDDTDGSEMECIEPDMDKHSAFHAVSFQDGRAKFVPQYTNEPMWILDLSKQEYSEEKKFSIMSEKCFGRSQYPVVYRTWYKNVMYFAVGNVCYQYDFNTGIAASKTVGGKDADINSVCFDGHTLWATFKDKSDLLYINNEEKSIPVKGMQSYSGMYSFDDMIVVLPQYSNNIVLVEKEDGSYKARSLVLGGTASNCRSEGGSSHVNCRVHDGVIYIFPHTDRGFYAIERESRKVKRVILKYADCKPERQRILNRGWSENEPVSESIAKLDVKCMIDYAENTDVSASSQTGSDRMVGSRIWNAV